MAQSLTTQATDLAAAKMAAVNRFIMEHVANSGVWMPLPGVHIHLPPWFSVHGLMLTIAATILVLLFGLCYRHKDPVPSGITSILELFVLMVRDQIAMPFLGAKDGRRLAPLFCSFFFFILCLNLMSLTPLFPAATANINVTLALALVTMGFMVIGGMVKNGVVGFFKAFLPHGVPWPLLILLGPLEFIGMFIKVGALAIRLFANLLAGHIVIFSLLSLLLMFGLLALPVVALVVLVFFLELLVAFLQAFIFTLLSAIFIGQLYHPEH